MSRQSLQSPVMEHSHRDSYIGEVVAEPQAHTRFNLGSFAATAQPRGFKVELSPDPNPQGAIVTHVSTVKKEANNYDFVLHITNQGNQSVLAKVSQI